MSIAYDLLSSWVRVLYVAVHHTDTMSTSSARAVNKSVLEDELERERARSASLLEGGEAREGAVGGS